MVIFVVSRKRSKISQEQLNQAADNYTNKLLKESNIDEGFAQEAVVNPMYAPEDEVHDNPTYLVS